MAEEKKSFILYADLITVIEKLVIRDRENKTNLSGELFLIILQFVNDKNPIPTDFILEMAFEPIRNQLKRDLIKYEDKKVERSVSGRIGNLKRYYIDIYNDFESGKYNLEHAENLAKVRKESLSDKNLAKLADNDNVNDTVTDNVNDKINYRAFGHLCISISEFNKLILEGFTKEQIDNTLNSVENFKGNKKYKSLYLTALNWLKKNNPTVKKDILNETAEEKDLRIRIESFKKIKVH